MAGSRRPPTRRSPRRPFDAEAIADAVLEVAGGPAGHHDAWIAEEERESAVRCLADIANHNPINDLERAIEIECQVKHAIATSNGSAALELALNAVGIESGDAVIVPALSFVAAANAVVHLGASPVFLDARNSDFGLSPRDLVDFLERETFCYHNGGPVLLRRTRQRLAAVIAVHVLGRPCGMTGLLTACSSRGIPLVEDAAEALGSCLCELPCGSIGNVAVLSFNYNKIVTGGGGGAVLTNDDASAASVRHLATTARVGHPWEVAHDAVAWNYRMPTICAAVASAQLAKLPLFLRAKKALAEAYREELQVFHDIEFPDQPADVSSNEWLIPIMVRPAERRDELLTALHKRGLMARALFTPLHLLAPYRESIRGGDLSCAEDLWARTVCLPSGSKLGERFL